MESNANQKYNSFETKSGNHYWISALGLAWNQLINSFTKQPIRLKQNDQIAQHMATNFNNCKFSTQDIQQKSYYVKSGFGDETVKLINHQTKLKFPQKSFTDLNLKLGPHDIISYAYLFKQLTFKVPFHRNLQKDFQFQGTKVQSFQAVKKDHNDQIYCSYYENKDKFMIHITDAHQKQYLYLIKDKQINSVEQAINNVQKNETSNAKTIAKIDYFQMPVIDVDIRHKVAQLVGKTIANTNLQGYAFSHIEEALKLKIDQTGAKVQQQGFFAMVGCCMSQTMPEPKYFLLDKPFWVVMKQRQAHPYLVAHIKNPVDNEK